MVVGVTGRIGSGKSAFCEILSKAHGCPVIDADALGHEALRTSEKVRGELIERFGREILDPAGGVDRGRLAKIVFAETSALADLNAIVHPWIVAQILARLAALRARGHAGIVLLDAALLLPWKEQLPLDWIVWVRSPDCVAIERLHLRGMPEEEARRRLASQVPEEEFRRHANTIVDNAGDRGALERQADRLWDLLARAQRGKEGTR